MERESAEVEFDDGTNVLAVEPSRTPFSKIMHHRVQSSSPRVTREGLSVLFIADDGRRRWWSVYHLLQLPFERRTCPLVCWTKPEPRHLLRAPSICFRRLQRSTILGGGAQPFARILQWRPSLFLLLTARGQMQLADRARRQALRVDCL